MMRQSISRRSRIAAKPVRDGRDKPSQTLLFASRLDACRVFLDQAHTPGMDLELPSSHRAAVTLGANLTKGRLVQGKFCRPLHSTQRFFVPCRTGFVAEEVDPCTSCIKRSARVGREGYRSMTLVLEVETDKKHSRHSISTDSVADSRGLFNEFWRFLCPHPPRSSLPWMGNAHKLRPHCFSLGISGVLQISSHAFLPEDRSSKPLVTLVVLL